MEVKPRHLEAVAEPAVGQEAVGGEEAEHGHHQVQELAEDEAVVVDVVLVVDVVPEELQRHTHIMVQLGQANWDDIKIQGTLYVSLTYSLSLLSDKMNCTVSCFVPPTLGSRAQIKLPENSRQSLPGTQIKLPENT